MDLFPNIVFYGYRAEAPAELSALQAAKWQPLLDSAADAIGARLIATEGIVPVVQDPEALAAARTLIQQ